MTLKALVAPLPAEDEVFELNQKSRTYHAAAQKGVIEAWNRKFK